MSGTPPRGDQAAAPRRRVLFRFPWRSARQIRDDVDEELRFHLDMRVDELAAAGVPRDAARAQATREFGDVEDARRYIKQLDTSIEAARRRGDFMGALRSDVVYAVRKLRAAPLFTITAVLTLALGIGANSAIFSAVNGVLLKPLPFANPEQLLRVGYAGEGHTPAAPGPVSAVDLDDWRAQRNVLADMGGYWYTDGQSGTDMTGLGEPRRLQAAYVTPGFYTTLGVAPVLGRVPRDEEMVRGASDRVVVLSHGFWQRQFGGDRAVIGRGITLDTERYEVVGVMPESFRFPSPRVEIFIPFSTIPDEGIPRVRPNRVLGVVARMKPGGTVAQASAELGTITRALAERYPDETRGATTASVAPLHDALVGTVRTGLLVLLGAVGFVLLIAAVNLGGLLLARASAREREVAVRVALGAGRGRVVRQLVTESLVLSALGGAAGLLVAYFGSRALVALARGQLPRSEDVGLDTPVLLFTLGVSLLTGLVFGLVPAIRASSPDLQQSLREGARGSTRGSGGVRDAFVVAEVALAMVLVVGAGLMARSFVKLTQVDLGFVPEQRVAVNFSISSDRHPGAEGPQRVYQEILERVRAVPGVMAAGGVRDLPFRGDGEPMEFVTPGTDPAAAGDAPKATRMFATDGFFGAMGIPLIAGRDLAPTDRPGAPFAVVVNQALARRYFPGASPVGQTIRFRGDTTPLQIVGLVGDTRQTTVDEVPAPRIYFSVFQLRRSKVNLVARTRDDPAVTIKRMTDAIRAVDPQQTITASYTLGEAVGDAVARPRLLTVLLGVFAVMGLVLGALGIYGVLAYLVGQRAREIGVRLALGAHPRAVLAMILGRGLRLAVAGVVVGLAGALLLTRVMAGVLYGVTPTDPVTFAGVALALLAVAALASWLPARRATRVDPLVAMRAD